MATTRIAFGSILGAVENASNAVGGVFTAATQSVGMLNTFVGDASKRQQIRSALDMEDFVEILAIERAQESTERKLKVKEFCSQSVDHLRLFEESYTRIQNLLKPSDNNPKT